MDNNEVLGLLPKSRKNLLRIIFSRLGLVVITIIAELVLLVGAYLWAFSYFKWLVLVQFVFTIIMILYLFNCSMDASAKLTWLFLIMLAPVPASIFLWFTQKNFGHRMVKERTAKLIEATKDMLQQDKDTLYAPELIESGTDDLCRYVNRSGCFPIYKNTSTTFFPSGEAKFEAMLEELKKAEKFIFLEYFIITEGFMWGSILKILADKAAQGVDVRVMYDGMCEISTLTADYPKRLAKLGIKCKPFSAIHPFLSSHYNYRDHRKILVIDGKVAFNGGVNLADEYINKEERFGHWKDTAVMVKGQAVESFTLMFLQMWNLTEQDVKWDECKVEASAESDGYVMPYCDCPLDGERVGESVYMDILYRAKHYVHIMTPYLILDNELETALKYAAQRGVDVKIILPGIPDKKIAYSLAKSHYSQLVKYGVKIYEYDPGFVHAKIFVSDNEKAVVGTINLDYRSLYHHFECATYMYKTSCVSEIEADYQETLSKCSAVTNESIKNEKIFYKVFGAIVKILAPLM
ncbi:MAG: cardiolipin synthase [Firmicutes bacterium]|nr:cardiolipin synthase [Bacillota bacterium]